MKGQVVNTLGFAGQFLANSVTAAQKTAMDIRKQMGEAIF